ncbi:hypothetical protein BME99_05605 [Pseudomonas protegens]|nr:hypothetical protein BME99_05605 [Pseudomonas protegens]
MGTGRADKHNGLARLQGADAVQDFQLQQRPALLGFGGDLAQGLFGHARVVFKKHAVDILPIIEIAHVADKTDHRTHPGIRGVHGVDFSPGIERC